jgi:hypothetical protein
MGKVTSIVEDVAASVGCQPNLALERTRGLVFVRRRRESMNLDQSASFGASLPRAAQLPR